MKQIKKNKSFVQWFVSLFIVLFLGIGSILFSTGIVFAAAVTTGVAGLNAESSGSATWTSSGGTITGSVKANKSSGCLGDSYSAQTGTLTFTNSSERKGQLSFDYSVGLNGGSCSIDGSTIEAGASFSKTLNAGETIVVSITSNAANETATTVSLSNLKLTPETDVSITFKAPENGTYTVNGEAITDQTVKSFKTTDTVTLSAATSGQYKFYGWKNETTDEYIATTATATVSFTENAIIFPEFVSITIPVWQVGSMLYQDLNQAISYSQSSGAAKIALISNGTLPAGNYVIPSGKTLLIPFDEAQTVYTTAPGLTLGSDGKPAAHVNPSAFITLTMASGSQIIVSSGAILSVPSKLSAVGTGSGSWNATPTGKHGRITMNEGSSITVQDGGKLYCYGYIAGNGTVYAEQGSEVWECFQNRSWRGGTAVSGMAGNSGEVFPINQYYVQNIETTLILEYGAVEKVYTAVNASNQQFGANAVFVGSNGLFRIDSQNGTISKRYIPNVDRMEFITNGNVSIMPMNLRITGLPLIGTLDLNTEDYVLPINSNISIIIESGTTTIGQNVAFLPGVEVTIEENAVLSIGGGNSLYVYDKDQWGAYAASGQQLVVVGYSTANGTTAKRTAANLVDVKIDVKGRIEVNGEFYTTESGASIICTSTTSTSNNRQIVFNRAAGTQTKTYMATQSGSDISYPSIPITAAQLQNADSTYVNTSDAVANDTFNYKNNKWIKGDGADNKKTIKVYEDGVLVDTLEYDPGESFTFSASNWQLTSEYPLKHIVVEGGNTLSNDPIIRRELQPDTPYTMPSDIPNDATATVFYGGWKQYGIDYKYIDYSSPAPGTPFVGIKAIKANDSFEISNVVSIEGGSKCLFNKDGCLSIDEADQIFLYKRGNQGDEYEDGDNEYYHIKYGVVQCGEGLFNHEDSSGNYLYYSKEDGTLARNGTFYVPNIDSKLNDYYVNGNPVEGGLYYFDPSCHMYYGNSLIDNDHEFGVINSGITQGGNN